MDQPSKLWYLLPRLLAMLVVLAGCNATSGRITPAHFRFKTVVRPSPDGAGGWRAVCIDARFTHGNTGLKGVCKFEVGTPLSNARQGTISLGMAQEESAKWANRAAHMVMSKAKPEDLTGLLCQEFRTLYHAMLEQAIRGAKVSGCTTPGIETVLFDITP